MTEVKLYKNIAMMGKPPTVKDLLKKYKLPFPRRAVIVAPDKPDDYITYALYQSVLATKSLITKSLGNKYEPYYNNYRVGYGLNIKNSKFTTTDVFHDRYFLLLKSKDIMQHLYVRELQFIKSRRQNYSYYIDKFKNKEEISGTVQVEVTSKDWTVFEGNHRAIAQYDSGYKQMLCEVRFNYHEIFRLDYPFVKVW